MSVVPTSSSPAEPEFSPYSAGAYPDPESRLRLLVTHAVAVVAILGTAGYLTWRAGFTLSADLWLSVPLWILELHAFVSLILYAFGLWDVDRNTRPAPVHRTDLRVAVLIPTYNEPREVLLPTVAAAVALAPAHETWVLDDGHRDWVRQLAGSLGARYLARTDRSHAKAGNINNALSVIEADVVAILDADHVATGRLLTHTLGYFDDPQLAVVQTPQDFYNFDSFEHAPNRSWFFPQQRLAAYSEQRIFYRAIQPGKNRVGAAFWCGTGALVRVAALAEVGGVARETLTEDIHTTVRLHRRGWRTVYHNEVLAYGLAARDAGQYQSQRLRWGTGAMQLLHLERPFTRRGLALGQRLAYAGTLFGWFDAWRSLGYVLLPMAVLFSGANPIRAALLPFLLAFGATFTLQRLSLALLSRGYAPQGMAAIFEFIRMPANLAATLTYFTYFGRRDRQFQVTAKDGASNRRRHQVPGLLLGLLGLSGVALVWFLLTDAGLTPTHYRVTWTAYGACLWMLVNAGLVAAAAARIRSDRFATDRRTAVRMKVGVPSLLDRRPVDLIDVSIGGALVRSPAVLPLASTHQLVGRLEGRPDLRLRAEERSRQTVGEGGVLIGLRFVDGQEPEIAKLSVLLSGARPVRPAAGDPDRAAA